MVLQALKQFEIVSNRQLYSCCLHKHGGLYEIRFSLCNLSWFKLRQIVLRARNLPGCLNVIADKLPFMAKSLTQSGHSSRRYSTRFARSGIVLKWTFVTTRYNELPRFVSPVSDRIVWAVDALSLSWDGLDLSAFPPVSLLGKVTSKILDHLPSKH